jgi:hypothetical protein
MITIGTTLGATRFITGTTTIGAETRTGESTATVADLTAIVAEIVAALTPRTGLPMPAAAARKAVPVLHPSLLKETTRQLEDMRNPAVRAERARAPSPVTTMAERQEPIPHVAAPAWAAEREAEEDFRAAVALTAAAATNRSVTGFLLVVKFRTGKKICGEQS